MSFERTLPVRTRRLGLIVSVGIVLLLLVIGRSLVMRGLFFAWKPLSGAATWVHAHTSGALVDHLTLSQEIQRLTDELNTLTTDVSQIKQLEEENATLRSAIGLPQLAQRPHVGADVLSRTLNYRVSELFLNRGSLDGVEVGMPVLSPEGALMAKISRVQPTTSVATTLLDPRSTTAATLLNRTRTLGVIQGVSGSILSLEYVPQDEDLNTLDLVVTSGLEERIEHGLPLGRVTSIRRDDAAPFQEAVVEPLFDARRVLTVFILLVPGLCGSSGCSDGGVPSP